MHHIARAHPGHRRVLKLSSPSSAAQIRRATEVGPGFLNYCPTRPGREPAKYDLSLPGSPVAHGWCQTAVMRKRRYDIVTFRAYWDARPINHTDGMVTFSYRVPWAIVIGHTISGPTLIYQSGIPPN